MGRTGKPFALAQSDDVRVHIPVVNREWLAGASHAGHHFVGDQEDVMPAADLGDALDVAFGWRRSAQSRTHKRLKDECRDRSRGIVLKKCLQLVSARQVAPGELEIQRTMKAKTRVDVSPFGQQPLVGRAASHVAAEGHGAESAAVIALPPRNNTKPTTLSALNAKLLRQFGL